MFLLAGLVAAGVGLLFGIPSLRIKGFYLAVATLAAQFFLIWLFNKVALVRELRAVGHDHRAAAHDARASWSPGPRRTAPVRYVVALGVVVLLALVAKNLVRGRVGRSWMAIRDRDIAAEIIGIRPLPTKLLAFAISSFYCGVAGAEFVFLYLGSAETLAFDINLSFLVLFMVIIGGLGSVLGSFLGAAFIVLVPIFLTNAPHLLGLALPMALQKQIELMVFGGADRLLPDRRAARAGAAVADQQGKASPVAVPPLTGQRRTPMTMRQTADRPAGDGRWPRGRWPAPCPAQEKIALHPAAGVSHGALRAERHPDRQRVRATTSRSSTSGTAGSTGSRSCARSARRSTTPSRAWSATSG